MSAAVAECADAALLRRLRAAAEWANARAAALDAERCGLLKGLALAAHALRSADPEAAVLALASLEGGR